MCINQLKAPRTIWTPYRRIHDELGGSIYQPSVDQAVRAYLPGQDGPQNVGVPQLYRSGGKVYGRLCRRDILEPTYGACGHCTRYVEHNEA